MDLNEMGWEGTNKSHVVFVRNMWQAFVDREMNLWVPYAGNS
jgi:hypothetical protein